MKKINFHSAGNGIFFTLILAAIVLCPSLLAHASDMPPVLKEISSLDICQPTENALVDNELEIGVQIDSTYELKQVKAIVEDRETSLAFSDCACTSKVGCLKGWAGTLSLEGLSRGQKTLIITATDLYDNTAQAQRIIAYDQHPRLTVTAPLNETVARPELYISVTCTDDDPAGCVSITVTADPFPVGNNTVLGTGKSGINGTVSLPTDYNGKLIPIQFYAVDSANQASVETRWVYVDLSNRLIEVESVSGRIWDVQPERILFMESFGGADLFDMSWDTNILKIRERSSGQETVLMNESGKIPQYGFLTPKGAIFDEYTEGNDDRLYEWRDGALINLSGVLTGSSLKVKGQYAIWSEGRTLILRDLIAGTNITVGTDAGNIDNDVADNGDVVYWGMDYNIYRYREGETDLLAHDTDLWNTLPLTDGINVVYRKHTPCCLDQVYSIAMYGSSGEIILTPARPQDALPGRDYQLNNGWIAYTVPGDSGQVHVWLRSPSGDNQQLTYFSESSYVNSVGPNGEVALTNDNRLYLVMQDGRLLDIASELADVYGKSFWFDDQFYVTIGRSLFRVETSELISTPHIPHGRTHGATGTSYTYSTRGSASDFGHPVQYLFDWGDGTYSDWLPVAQSSVSKSWTSPGTYKVRAMARCSDHPSILSSWSESLSVTIDSPLPSPPTDVQASDGDYTDRVRVTWSASLGATSYTVYRATSRWSTKTPIGRTFGTTYYDDRTARVERSYYYCVTACNASGTSGYSAYDKGFRSRRRVILSPFLLFATNRMNDSREPKNSSFLKEGLLILDLK